jgi:cysteinyl-tRNA synthetase
VFVHDLLERWSAAAIRLLILTRPWNESWEFSEYELERVEGELETLRSLESKRGASDSVAREVRRVLFENLDVPGALAVARDAGGEVLRDLDRLIGLTTVKRWS